MFRHQHQSNLVDVSLASLDLPDTISPQYHIWVASRRTWLHCHDRLPQFMDGGPDGRL
ncbi:hypothetical protein [Snodgrassella sp. CFCC 13594]|uniref:hypothetical protein n=1 Tax=Snodgrassella sp. CFCC 13594 TaxID=1775559 RepID=UPI000B248BEE|nr:hypothetical protein [Snodgrassella sp. CFCC 13594]